MNSHTDITEAYEKLPGHFAKSLEDEWHFLVRMKTGELFIFQSASVSIDGWIHLNPVTDRDLDASCFFFDAPVLKEAYVISERGIDIQVSEVAWIADGIS